MVDKKLNEILARSTLPLPCHLERTTTYHSVTRAKAGFH